MRNIVMGYINEQPVQLAYKNVPKWVVKKIDNLGNCYLSKKTYISIFDNLKEYYSDKNLESIKCEGGGFVVWVR